MEEAAGRELTAKGLTVATAESCTGGLVAAKLVNYPGISAALGEAHVTYANEAKIKYCGVKPETLAAYGAVSEQTAREMARGVRLALGADVGIATTGIAGPGGGTPEQPVGTVYIAISTEEGENVKLLTLSPKRSREFIRICAATNAMSLVLKVRKKDKT
jgi:nicotinamide-nucleotide amidase